MADTRFYERAGPFAISELARIAEADYSGPDNLTLADVSALNDAAPTDLGFINNRKLVAQLAQCQAGAVLVADDWVDALNPQTQPLICADPYRGIALAAQHFYPKAARALPMPGDLQDGHQIHPSAKLEENVQIGYGALIGPNAEIGRGSVIGAGAVIGHGVSLGRDCVIGARVIIGYALLGDGVIIHGGSVIGADGFGFAPGETHTKIPQLGRVLVQAEVEIGVHCAIDRGSLSDTIIGEGSKIDNHVQLAHNVVLGRHCLLSSHVAIAGSASLGDYVQMGGQSGVVGHVAIGAHSMIGAKSGVMRALPAHSDVSGMPARPRNDIYRDAAFLSRLRKKTQDD